MNNSTQFSSQCSTTGVTPGYTWLHIYNYYYYIYTDCRYVTSTVTGAGRSSEVERSLMVQWVVGSILHELFLVPASAPRLV